AGLERVQRTPAERVQRIKRLAVGCVIFLSARCQQSLRIELGFDRIFNSAGSKQSGGDGCGFYGTGHPTRSHAASSSWFNDQRNVDGGIVNEQSVFFLTVIAKRFAMIAEQHNRSSVIKMIVLEPGCEASELMVCIRDFAVVEVLLEL